MIGGKKWGVEKGFNMVVSSFKSVVDDKKRALTLDPRKKSLYGPTN